MSGVTQPPRYTVTPTHGRCCMNYQRCSIPRTVIGWFLPLCPATDSAPHFTMLFCSSGEHWGTIYSYMCKYIHVNMHIRNQFVPAADLAPYLTMPWSSGRRWGNVKIHTYVYRYICICVYIQVCTHFTIPRLSAERWDDVHTYTYVCIHIYICIYICIYIYMYMCSYMKLVGVSLFAWLRIWRHISMSSLAARESAELMCMKMYV